jgi:dihydroorotate dehydrogenase electron transfer subunit
MKAGDKLGIRGPYGNPFNLVPGKTCVVSGGCGIAPIMPLIQILKNPMVIVGCQTKARLLFKDKVEKYNICTDDGSLGHKGFVTEQLAETLKAESFDMLYTCGPEPMMKAVFELCEKYNIPVQASLERFMICGIGICGQCMCDNLRICQEGPVLVSEQLRKLKDFGNSAMIKTGEKVPLKEYYSYRTKY